MHYVIDSTAYRALSPVGRSLLVEIARRFNGRNNGFIGMSVRDAAERLRVSKDTGQRAFKELEDLGFIVCASRGHFDRKSPHASEWRITVWACNRTGALPSKEFMRWRPQSDSQGELPPKGRSTGRVKKQNPVRLVGQPVLNSRTAKGHDAAK
jgi:hypothetical protein